MNITDHPDITKTPTKNLQDELENALAELRKEALDFVVAVRFSGASEAMSEAEAALGAQASAGCSSTEGRSPSGT